MQPTLSATRTSLPATTRTTAPSTLQPIPRLHPFPPLPGHHLILQSTRRFSLEPPTETSTGSPMARIAATIQTVVTCPSRGNIPLVMNAFATPLVAVVVRPADSASRLGRICPTSCGVRSGEMLRRARSKRRTSQVKMLLRVLKLRRDD